MPLTRSEAMYFALGVAVGGTVGANWGKIRPIVEQLLGNAAEGAGDAYGDLARLFGERFEAFQDHAAERRQPSPTAENGPPAQNGKPRRRRRKTSKQARNGRVVAP
jgi:hypothetical protein